MIKVLLILSLVSFVVSFNRIIQQKRSIASTALFSDRNTVQKIQDRLGLAEVRAGDDLPLSKDVSELPNSFNNAVERAVECTNKCLENGKTLIRIDFDTSIGDMTLTSLKQSLPFLKEYIILMSRSLSLSLADEPLSKREKKTNENDDIVALEEEAQDEKKGKKKGPELIENLDLNTTMRIFLPDMGAAALLRRDWKMGTKQAEIPLCVFTGNIQNDPIDEKDKLIVIVCPLYSEADYVKRVIDLCDGTIPIVMLNPQLVNMDQGYGVRARNLRKDVINQFTLAYKLKTMKFGAIVREWPSGFSLWNDDSNEPEGYRLLQTYLNEPPSETVLDIYDEANPDPNEKKQEPNIAEKAFKEVFGFFQGLQKL